MANQRHRAPDPLPVIHFQVDAGGRIRAHARRARELLGYTASELDGCPLVEICDPGLRERLAGHLARLEVGEVVEATPIHLLRQDGTPWRASLSAAPRRDQRGAYQGFDAWLVDLTGYGSGDPVLRERLAQLQELAEIRTADLERTITQLQQQLGERQRIARALHASEVQLRSILQTVVDGIVTIDEGGIIQDVNPAVERIFGYGAAETLGQNVRMLMPDPDRTQHDEYLSCYRRTGESRILGVGRELLGRRKDGSSFPMELAIDEVRHGGERLFIGIVRDISVRKRAEEELRRLEERFELAVSGANDGIWDQDIRTGTVYRSARLREILGYSFDEDTSPLDAAELFHPDEIGQVREAMDEYLARRVPRFGMEHRVWTKDGRYKWVLARAHAVWDDAGNPIRLVGVATDITARKRAERQLQTLLDSSRRLSESLDLEAVLRISLETATEALAATYGELWLRQEDRLRCVAARGVRGAALLERRSVAAHEGYAGAVVQSASAAVMTDRAGSSPSLPDELRRAGLRVLSVCPLLRRGQVIGVLGVGWHESADMSDEPGMHELRDALAEMIATAVENARLHAAVRGQAAQEERIRIAHEMHDNLGPTLTVIGFQASTAQTLLERGEVDSSRKELAHLYANAEEAVSIIRDSILSLRLASESTRLWQALPGYIEEFGAASDLQMIVTGLDALRSMDLEAEIEVNLLRIFQEALRNIRKHADCRRVAISVQSRPTGLSIVIADNGIGFDVAEELSATGAQFGVQTMHERAARIGGELTIESTPGEGTQLRLLLPSGKEAGGGDAANDGGG